jgi:outer membrane receptor protein involved in Fe transport
MAPLAMAQSVTGAVAGRANAGEQITVTNPDTGLSRTVTVGKEGTYRVAQLPPGDYTLVAGSGTPISISVSLGGTTTVNLTGGGAVDLDVVQVVGSRIVNRVDVRSTETATNINRQELARLPVDQTLASVALLAPGVVASGATFGGLTFGGSSVAENAVYINGLNVTDSYRRQGFSSVPFGFYQEFQVKTGGYSAEFGRTTGGVINAVTRSGSNEFQSGAQVTLEPAAWASKKDDHYHSDGTVDERGYTSRDSNSFYKTNVWASGPIVKDKLFFFAMYENRDSSPKDFDGNVAFLTKSNDDFWGAKFDWRINDDHSLELLAFSDKAESPADVYAYTWAAGTLDRLKGDSISNSGGDNWSLTYTGHLTDNFVAKAMYGVNKRSASNSSSQDPDCSIVTRAGSYTQRFGEETTPEGCHPTDVSINTRHDKREAARLDFEWTLGDHLLRFGADREVMDSDASTYYPGDGRSYQVQAATPGGSLPGGGIIPAGTTAIVDARRYVTGTPVTTVAQAIYVEDIWSVTPNLVLNLGLRADKFHNKYASGVTFTEADFGDMISPRVGFSWDMKGDGTTKLFGNAGRYYIPLTNKLADYFAGTTDEHTYYVLDGWAQMNDPVAGNYLSPILGQQIGPVNDDGNIPAPTDFRTVVARDLDAVMASERVEGDPDVDDEQGDRDGNREVDHGLRIRAVAPADDRRDQEEPGG